MPMRREQIAAALKYLQDKADLRGRAERALSLDPQEQDLADIAVETAAGFVPGVGQALAARDVERARRANDPTGMAMASMGAVPGGRLAGLLKGYDPTMAKMGDVYDFRTKEKMIADDQFRAPTQWEQLAQNQHQAATQLLKVKNQELIDRYIDIEAQRQKTKLGGKKHDQLTQESDAITEQLGPELSEQAAHLLYDTGTWFKNSKDFRKYLNLTPEQRAKHWEKTLSQKK